MKTYPLITIGMLTAAIQSLSAQGVRDHPPVDPRPGDNKVQIALLLDTSNSMDGLIDQAKTQLWKVVNTFIDARRDGAAPFVEVALYEYGNNNQHVGNQYIRQVQPFTRDLDEVSKQMFALKTNGGEEYCGAVIQSEIDKLNRERIAFVEEEAKKQAAADGKTLDEVVVETTRKQASALGYKFGK